MSILGTQKIRDAVTKTARILARDKVEVRQRGGVPHVAYNDDGSIRYVQLPVIPDNPPEDFLVAVQGFLDHEIAHVLKTNNPQVRAVCARGETEGVPLKRTATFANVFEDVRIEKAMVKDYPGAARNLSQMLDWVIANMTEPAVKSALELPEIVRPGAIKNACFVAFIYARAGNTIATLFMDKYDLWQYFADVDAVFPDLADQIAACNSSADTAELGLKFARAFTPPPPPPGDPSEDEEEATDEADETDDQNEGDGDGQGTAEEEAESEENCASDEDDEGGEEEDAGDGDGDQAADEDGADADEKDEGDGEADDQADEADEDEAGEDDGDAGEGGGDDDDQAEGDSGGDEDPDGEDDGEGAGAGDDEEFDDQADEDEDEDEDEDGASDADGGGSADEGEEGEDEELGGSDDAEGDDGDEGEGEESGDETGADGAIPDEAEVDKDAEVEPVDEAQAGAGSLEDPYFDADEVKDMDDAVRTLLADMTDGVYSKQEYLEYTRDFDLTETVEPTFHVDHSEMEKRVLQTSATMQKDLQRIITARSQAVMVPGFRRGRVNPSALHRLEADDDRVFRRKQENQTKDVAVQLVVDCSGSMKGHKFQLAMDSAWAFSSVLDKLNIKNEVIGFTTDRSIYYGGEPEKYHELAEGVDKFAKDIGVSISKIRWEPLYHPVFKGFEERFTNEIKGRLAYATTPTWQNRTLANNLDGASLTQIAPRLLARREKRKLMIVFSDGTPCGAQDDMIVQRHLKRVVEEIEATGAEVIGVGICSDSVDRFYKRHFVVSKLEELPARVINELKRFLTA